MDGTHGRREVDAADMMCCTNNLMRAPALSNCLDVGSITFSRSRCLSMLTKLYGSRGLRATYHPHGPNLTRCSASCMLLGELTLDRSCSVSSITDWVMKVTIRLSQRTNGRKADDANGETLSRKRRWMTAIRGSPRG